LLLAVGLSFARSLDTQQRDVAGNVQIQIAAPKSERDKAVEDALAIVKATPGIVDAVVLKEDQVAALLKPWLGDEDALEGVELPVLIDLKTRSVDGKAFDATNMKKALESKIGNVRVNTPQQWIEQLAKILRLAQGVLLLLALCLMASLVALAVLIARTALRLHFKTVNILHLFGATDDYILRQFQIHNAWMVGRGALIGSLVAAVILFMAHALTTGAQSPVLPEVAFGLGHVALFIILPVLIAFVSFVATRLTVQSMLQRMH
jgi:cell division transport system permease protein